MQEILNFFISTNGAALVVALIIFLITLWLVVKRLIGFVITIILLAFALISGFFVANADLLREILKGFTPGSTQEEKDTLVKLKNQFFKAVDDLKVEFHDQRAEFQKIIDNAKSKEETPAAPAPAKEAPAAPKEEKKNP